MAGIRLSASSITIVTETGETWTNTNHAGGDADDSTASTALMGPGKANTRSKRLLGVDLTAAAANAGVDSLTPITAVRFFVRFKASVGNLGIIRGTSQFNGVAIDVDANMGTPSGALTEYYSLYFNVANYSIATILDPTFGVGVWFDSNGSVTNAEIDSMGIEINGDSPVPPAILSDTVRMDQSETDFFLTVGPIDQNTGPMRLEVDATYPDGSIPDFSHIVIAPSLTSSAAESLDNMALGTSVLGLSKIGVTSPTYSTTGIYYAEPYLSIGERMHYEFAIPAVASQKYIVIVMFYEATAGSASPLMTATIRSANAPRICQSTYTESSQLTDFYDQNIGVIPANTPCILSAFVGCDGSCDVGTSYSVTPNATKDKTNFDSGIVLGSFLDSFNQSKVVTHRVYIPAYPGTRYIIPRITNTAASPIHISHLMTLEAVGSETREIRIERGVRIVR